MLPEGALQDRVALVTGSATGIGWALANTLSHLTALVNNAAGSFCARAEEMSVNAWQAVIDTVLNGPLYCAQAVGREVIASGGGSILNIGSTAAFHGGPSTL